MLDNADEAELLSGEGGESRVELHSADTEVYLCHSRKYQVDNTEINTLLTTWVIRELFSYLYRGC